MTLSAIAQKLIRKKALSDDTVGQTDLKRCLTTFDLIGLGVGSTLGAGLYVVSGQVALQNSGPSIIISFLIAAVASAFAGLCYAEFAARIPRAGSAYIYSYVTVGEFMAFVIGWNLVLEYVIGTASVARGWSGYVNSLANNKISDFFNNTMHMDIPQLSEYPDFLAFFMTLIVTVVLSVGVKESTTFNNVFTTVNLLVVLYITICGVFKIDWDNWSLTEVPAHAGKGGFMPFGFSGMMAGAATCFYAFVGFDAIATCGEETKNPQKSIPIAIIVSLLFIFFSYFCVSGVMTLMVPYYLLDKNAPLPEVFKRVGWGVARYVITTGALAGLTTSLLGAMFPLPRVLYAMGTDGVIFKFLGKINARFQTPIIGTAISGVFSGFMAMIFDLQELVDMMSIGTLLAYTLVSISVLILRYESDERDVIRMSTESLTFKLKNLFVPDVLYPSPLTSRITKILILIICIILSVLAAVLIFCEDYLSQGTGWTISIVSILTILVIVGTVMIQRQPQSSAELSFKVPFLPWLPVLSSFINIYLMLKLSFMTWMRFVIWLVIGFIIYVVSGYMYEGRQKNECLDVPNAFEKPLETNSDPPRSSHARYNEKTHLLE